MKRIIALSLVAFTACNSTTTITEYDADGKITRVIEQSESAIKSIETSLERKAVFVYGDGLDASIKASMDHQSSYMPTGKISFTYGKMGVLTIPVVSDSGTSLDTAKHIPAIVSAVDPDIKVDFDGITKGAEK